MRAPTGEPYLFAVWTRAGIHKRATTQAQADEFLDYARARWGEAWIVPLEPPRIRRTRPKKHDGGIQSLRKTA